MPVLLTHSGSRLHATPAGLAHGPGIGERPAGPERDLIIRPDGETLRLEGPGIGEWTFNWQRQQGQNAIRLGAAEGFLNSAPEGKIGFTETGIGEAGLFLLLNDSQYADLLYVTRHRWAMALPLAKSRPPEMAELLAGFILRVCGCDIPLARPDIAFPRIWRSSVHAPGEIIFQYGDFLVGRARLYRPLIYLCASGDDLVFAMLTMFLESLEVFGAYDGHILILADREAAEIARITPAAIRPRTSVLKLDYASAAEFATARYRVAGHSLAEFQPILYADCNIVAAAPVEPLLADLVQQDGICFACEYHDTRNTQAVAEEMQNWYGRPIFMTDPDWSGRISGVNTGLIGFTRIAEAERIFPLILAVMAQYQIHGNERLRSAEQASASYVVQKLAACQPDFLNRYVQVLNHNQPDATTRHFTLVNFNHKVNNARKLDSMGKYFNALQERAADPAVPVGPNAVPGVI
jgi:hypothetical protein